MARRFLLFLALACAHAAAADFKRNEVIAFVGGEDMVVAAESGYLEFLLVKALPTYHLRFRSLAWEGDTVVEQRRDLNYPPLEQQLDQIHATVVLTEFGQSEALMTEREQAAAEKDFFYVGYLKLLQRLGFRYANENPMRDFIAIYPPPFEGAVKARVDKLPPNYPGFAGVTSDLIDLMQGLRSCGHIRLDDKFSALHLRGFTRDGLHLNDRGQAIAARFLASEFLGRKREKTSEDEYMPPEKELTAFPVAKTDAEKHLLRLIVEKNRLWFNYYRPQNWAFLAGDRTSQPSSRDHIDPTKRWFPDEMKKWLPLIEAKEEEIDRLAAKMASAENP